MKRKQTFNIIRADTLRSNASFLGRSFSGTLDDLESPIIEKNDLPNINSNQHQYMRSETMRPVLVPKISSSDLQKFLESYRSAQMNFKEEEFSQQSEALLNRIATESNSINLKYFIQVPTDLKKKFPIFQILVSICQVFMFNEIEIAAFSCIVDTVDWSIEAALEKGEENNLQEFPSNLGVEIDSSCKRLIIYLILIAFTAKVKINERNEMDPIQAYCEKICFNFIELYNRFTKSNPLILNLNALDINKRYKLLSKKQFTENIPTFKDYDRIADEIVGLTNTYCTKLTKIDLTQPKNRIAEHKPTKDIKENQAASNSQNEIIDNDESQDQPANKEFHRHATDFRSLYREKSYIFDYPNHEEPHGISHPVLRSFSRQNSGFQLNKRQNTFDLSNEEPNFLRRLQTLREDNRELKRTETKTEDEPRSASKQPFEKKNSIIFPIDNDGPRFSRMNSNVSNFLE